MQDLSLRAALLLISVNPHLHIQSLEFSSQHRVTIWQEYIFAYILPKSLATLKLNKKNSNFCGLTYKNIYLNTGDLNAGELVVGSIPKEYLGKAMVSLMESV